MWKKFAVFAAILVGITAIALSQQEKATISGEDAIATRQESMDMSAITLRSMGDAMKAGREANTQAYPATALAKWAKVLPKVFPVGSGEGETSADSQALRLIRQDRKGFEHEPANMLTRRPSFPRWLPPTTQRPSRSSLRKFTTPVTLAMRAIKRARRVLQRSERQKIAQAP